MTAHSWAELVAANLRTLGDDFRPNELAYLALTSKIEFPIRDRLAFRLRQRIAETSNLAVAREWKRKDWKRKWFDQAVVTDRSEAQLLLEAKAMYSFNLFTNSISTFVCACSNDQRKLQKYGAKSQTSPTLLTLALVTHPHRPEAIPLNWDGVVKYFDDIRHIPDKSISDVKRAIRQHLQLPDFPLLASGEIEGGFAFGTEVSVVYALFGPHDAARGV